MSFSCLILGSYQGYLERHYRMAYMLQVKIIVRLFYFFNSFSFFLKPAQLILSQPRSICFNLDQFGTGKKHRSQATSHRSLLANTGSILNIH